MAILSFSRSRIFPDDMEGRSCEAHGCFVWREEKFGVKKGTKTIVTVIIPREPRIGIHGLTEISEDPIGMETNWEISKAA